MLKNAILRRVAKLSFYVAHYVCKKSNYLYELNARPVFDHHFYYFKKEPRRVHERRKFAEIAKRVNAKLKAGIS